MPVNLYFDNCLCCQIPELSKSDVDCFTIVDVKVQMKIHNYQTKIGSCMSVIVQSFKQELLNERMNSLSILQNSARSNF